MDDVPYLMRGVTPVATESSVLVSSSPYLNNPRMRDWVATELLRRNGPDVPTPSGAYTLLSILKEIQDYDAVDALFQEERRKWPALDRWLSERYLSTFTREDLKQYPPGSVGGIYYEHLTRNNYQVDILARQEPKGDFDYWQIRATQTHDMEHILGGGGFDSIGELVPGILRLSYIYKFFSPKLANEMAAKQFFLSFRFIARTMLHYPECFQATWDAIDSGRRIAEASDAFFLAKYEDVFHLTPEAAREKLGVRGVRELDTRAASRIWDNAG